LAFALHWYIAPRMALDPAGGIKCREPTNCYISARMARNPDDKDQGRDYGQGSNTAWSIIGILFAGMIAWGGIGWLIDRATGSNLFLPFGILLGLGGALYLIIKRYGS
jgi:ATP synthase protein I